jgi:hypothetical protein
MDDDASRCDHEPFHAQIISGLYVAGYAGTNQTCSLGTTSEQTAGQGLALWNRQRQC